MADGASSSTEISWRVELSVIGCFFFQNGVGSVGESSSFDKEQLDELNRYFPGGGIDALAPHDALFDIQASIAELAYYREKLGFDSI